MAAIFCVRRQRFFSILSSLILGSFLFNFSAKALAEELNAEQIQIIHEVQKKWSPLGAQVQIYKVSVQDQESKNLVLLGMPDSAIDEESFDQTLTELITVFKKIGVKRLGISETLYREIRERAYQSSRDLQVFDHDQEYGYSSLRAQLTSKCLSLAQYGTLMATALGWGHAVYQTASCSEMDSYSDALSSQKNALILTALSLVLNYAERSWNQRVYTSSERVTETVAIRAKSQFKKMDSDSWLLIVDPTAFEVLQRAFDKLKTFERIEFFRKCLGPGI